MNALILNTAEKYLEAALICGERRFSVAESRALTHSETLLPAAEKLLTEAGIALKDLDYICVVTGPGSFTGIRIGIVTAAALAQTLNLKVAALNTLEVKAHNIAGAAVTVTDGGAGCLYAAEYGADKSVIREPSCLKCEGLEGYLALARAPYTLIADEAALKFAGVPAGAEIEVPVNNIKGLFGAALFAINQKRFTAYNGIEAVYLRKPQAERGAEDV